MMGEVIRVSGSTPDVGEFLKEAMLSQRFADVALCCPGGQRFLAHRLVLSAASSYLQEVLLAHSGSSSHCELITVILAEVEAPELAAILRFVYTGSATVPRPRLNAFLRAAEALRIRLPPLPFTSPSLACCTRPDCKLEYQKDVKISPKYLRCDQYPCRDVWYRDRGEWRDDSNVEESSCPRIDSPMTTVKIGPLPDSMSLGESRYDGSKCCPTIWSVPRSMFLTVGQQNSGQRTEEGVIGATDVGDCSATRLVPTDVDRLGQMSETRTDLSVEVRDSTTMMSRQQELCFSRHSYDYQNRSRTRDEVLTNNSTVYDRHSVIIRSRIGDCQNAALNHLDRSRSDHGEDLSCQENCHVWRSPRRHVANRVTASPWRQTIRPYHLPKLQPIVLQPGHPQQTGDDTSEVAEIQHPPEIARSPVTPVSPARQLPKSSVTTDPYYDVEVPIARDTSYDNIAGSLDADSSTPTRRQEYYSLQIPMTISTQITSSIGGNETVLQPHSNASSATRTSLRVNECNQSNVDHGVGYLGQVFQQPVQKPEISHPVSRLCDTIESNDTADRFTILETEKQPRTEGKLAERVLINSDSNNNDSIISNDASHNQRARPVAVQEEHRCDQCGKIFVTRASLKVHVRTHSGEKPFRCADCGKQFSQLRNYKYHRSVHEGTREFAATCPECGKYFNDRGYLSSHMKIHRNRKEYGCNECGKSFNQRVAYNMHVRIHTGVKPHQCDQCGKAFSRKMLLKQHLRTHSGERPYQCQVCQKAFADRSNMTLHTRLHSGLKPYQCTLCTKAFTKKHHLKTHLNYHTGTKPYSCPNCGLRFSQSSNMRTHFKKCTVNNGDGTKGGGKRTTDSVLAVDSSKAGQLRMISRTPTDTLTPPNSDQELSILTPISKITGIEVTGM